MSRSFDIVVIGAGAIGLSVAWRLLDHASKVCVVERAHVGAGASAAAAGMLAPSAEANPGEAASFALGMRSLALWPEMVSALHARTGIDVGYRTEGTLIPAFDEDEARGLFEAFETQRSMGAAVAWLTGDEARAIEAALSPDICAAISAPHDVQVDPERFTAALGRAFVADGGQVIEGVGVSRIANQDETTRLIVLDDGSTLAAPVVVLAAGHHSSRIEIDGDLALPIVPVKGEMIALSHPSGRAPVRSVIRARDAYVVPRGRGRIVVGATTLPGHDDLEVSDRARQTLTAGAVRAVPSLHEAAIERAWAGVRPGTVDGLPIIGPSTVDGVVVATGHYRNGILWAPASADLISGYVATGEIPELMSPFLPRRFAGSRSMDSAGGVRHAV